jgi:predicted nucleic acid-binding protein
MKVFVDSDVALDLLLDRKPFSQASAELFSHARERGIPLAISGNAFLNIHYILRDINKHKDARKTLGALRSMVRIVPADEHVVDAALASSFRDLEDAVQYFAACAWHADMIVTRNVKDFKESRIKVCVPEQALTLLRAKI